MIATAAASASNLADLDDLEARAAEAERACDWDTALELFRELTRRSIEAQLADRVPKALMGTARALAPDTPTEEAEELAWLSHEIAKRTGRMQDAVDALNLIATMLHGRNDLAGARALYCRVLERARDLGEDALVAKACLNLGVIAHTLGNLREARALYLESVSAGLRSGAPEHAMRAYNNLGMVCTALGEWLEAQLHLDRGIEIAERLNDVGNLARLHANRIEPLIHLGELDNARAEATIAESFMLLGGQQSGLADVGRLRAMMALADDCLDEADEELSQALIIAEEHHLDLCRPEILEQLALLRRRQGRDDEAVAALEEAFDCFFALGAKREVSRVAALLEDWRPALRERVRIGGT
jgi:eukaryotic-like serine/threonine-protein kinase